MSLQDAVQARVDYVGRSPAGRKFILLDLLDYGRDVHEFMQLFRKEDIEAFYRKHQSEIDALYEEDMVLLPDPSASGRIKLAVEKTLMIIEAEMEVKYDLARV